MKKLFVVLLIVALAGAIGFSSCTSPAPAPGPTAAPKTTAAVTPAKTYNWSLTVSSSRGEVSLYENLERYVKLIDQASGGKIKIKIYGPGELMPEQQMLQAVLTGTVEMSWGSATYYRSEIGGVADVEFSMPFEFENAMQVQDFFYNAGFYDFLTKIYEPKNLHYFGPAWSGALDIVSTKPVASLDDWKKLKTRTVGAAAELLSLIGVPTVFMPGSEVPMALKLKTIDAASYGSLDLAKTNGLLDYCKYWIRPSLYEIDRTSIMINQKLWNTLSPDLQAILNMAYTDHQMVRALRRWHDRAETIKEQVGQGKVQISQLPDNDVKELKAAAVKIWEKTAKQDANSAKAIQMLKDYLQIK